MYIKHGREYLNFEDWTYEEVERAYRAVEYMEEDYLDTFMRVVFNRDAYDRPSLNSVLDILLKEGPYA